MENIKHKDRGLKRVNSLTFETTVLKQRISILENLVFDLMARVYKMEELNKHSESDSDDIPYTRFN